MVTQGTATQGKSFRSLRTTLTFAFLFLSIIVLLVATGLEVYFNFTAQKKIIADQQQLIAQNAAGTVRNFIQERYNMLHAAADFSHLPAIRPEDQKLTLEKLLGQDLSLRWLTLLSPEGKELLNVSRLSGFAPDQPLTGGLQDDLYASVIRRGEQYVSKVIIDSVTNEPLVIVAVPIKNVFGDIRGALAAEVNLKFMWDLVGGLTIGKNGLAYVVDREGNLIAFGDVSRVLKRENLAHLREVSEFAGSDAPSDYRADISKGILGTYAASTYATLGTPDWAVVVELPLTEAYGVIIRMIELSLLILVFSFVLATVTGAFLSERITKPVIYLRNAAEEIHKGKLDAKIEIQSRNEIGQLADSFRDMTGQLAQSIRKLREEQARLLASINNLSLGFMLSDMRGYVVLKNSAVDSILGLGETDATLDVVAHAFEGMLDFKMHAAQCIRERKVIELKEVTYGKKILRIVFNPVVIMRDHEEVIGLVFLIEDVTEVKLLERTRDEFFLIASHELRTPLTAIRGNVEMIQDFYGAKIQDKEVLDMIADVHEASTRLIALVNDFLDVSHIEQHRIELKKESMDLASIAKEVMHD